MYAYGPASVRREPTRVSFFHKIPSDARQTCPRHDSSVHKITVRSNQGCLLVVEQFDGGEFLTFEHRQARTATGADVRDAIGEAELLHGRS